MTDPDSNDVRDLLGTALRDEPRSTLDPARMVRLGRRRVRLQRASAALGVMVVAAGITLGAALVHRGGGSGPDRISAAGTSSTGGPSRIAVTPTPDWTTGPISLPDTPSVFLPDAQRILQKQNQALAAVLSMPSGMYVAGGSLTFTPIMSVSKGYAGSQFTSRLIDKSGSGEFRISAMVVNSSSNAMSCGGSLMSCQAQLINGLTVLIETDHPTARTTRIFTVANSGNLQVNGVVDNIATLDGTTATRPTPPLSQDELARITAAIATAGQ